MKASIIIKLCGHQNTSCLKQSVIGTLAFSFRLTQHIFNNFSFLLSSSSVKSSLLLLLSRCIRVLSLSLCTSPLTALDLTTNALKLN
mmetsp:Transcript_38463/g.101997  ORF Transcript_38463/g.101997 Transcript_38463/m.101997 type:complete len:87 (+) Transcript_38463:75-335(+)